MDNCLRNTGCGLEKLAASTRAMGRDREAEQLFADYWMRDAQYKEWATLTEGCVVCLQTGDDRILNRSVEKSQPSIGTGWTHGSAGWLSESNANEFAKGDGIGWSAPLGRALRGRKIGEAATIDEGPQAGSYTIIDIGPR
jgi:hypothetical protein